MYQVVNQSSGIVVNKFTNRGDAQYWCDTNNVDFNGDYMPLYMVQKIKVAQEGSKTAAKRTSETV